MQKGFATFEIICVIFIIAVLMSAAIPNAVRMIDRAALDYETKKLYTDLRFVQSFDRMTYMQDSHFKTFDDESVKLVVYPDRYVFEKNAMYEIYSEHYFSYGVTAAKRKGTDVWQIKFDDMGKPKNNKDEAISDSLNLISRRGKKNSIVFDSVGRFRGGLEE